MNKICKSQNDKWRDMYNIAVQYYEKHGNLEVPDGYVTEEGQKLGTWIQTQRRCYINGKLLPERKILLEKIEMRFKPKWSAVPWDIAYAKVYEYYEQHHNIKIPKEYSLQVGYQLDTWLLRQEHAYANGDLPEERKELLEKLGMSFDIAKTDAKKVKWEEAYQKAKEYYEKYGDLEVPYDYRTSDGYLLNPWVSKQRMLYKKGLLPFERIKLLGDIGMRFTLKYNTKPWDEAYELAKEYYEINGHLKIPQLYRTSDGYFLGGWVSAQKKAYRYGKLSEERRILLEKIGISFERKKMLYTWEMMYEKAKDYYNTFHNLNIPKSYVTEDGYALGSWLYLQKINYNNNTLPTDKAELLTALGMNFTIQKKSISWEDMYEKAKEYYEKYGNLLVKRNYVTEDGLPLGVWINTQRYFHTTNRLIPERTKLLEDIGMRFDIRRIIMNWDDAYLKVKEYYKKFGNLDRIWDGQTDEELLLKKWIINQQIYYSRGNLSHERVILLSEVGVSFDTKRNYISWDEMYEIACKYYATNGNSDIPLNYRTEDDHPLGSWLACQKRLYRNNLLDERKTNLLRDINVVFDLQNENITWEQAYLYAKRYYEEYGNLKVLCTYTTKEGYLLGNWIIKQRQLYKAHKLEKDRELLLSKIGMIWGIGKNQENVNSLCLQYGININDLKRNISYHELVVKIEYLLQNDLPLYIDGKICDIFNMSNINMQVKYGISTQELVENYYIEEQAKVRKLEHE